MKVNEKHDKYCRLSKFANKLCGRCFGNRCDACNLMQDKTGWETCAIPSQQVEVVEKDLIDQVVDSLWESDFPSSPLPKGRDRDIFRKLLTNYVKRLEAERGKS